MKKATTDYDFITGEQPDSLLVAAGRRLDVACLRSMNVLALQTTAIKHAAYQAVRAEQGHQRWDQRSAELREKLPNFREFSEVCAESWPDQAVEEAAEEMFKSWRQSPDHWQAVTSLNDGWGASMAYCDRRRVWYACMIFTQISSSG